MLISAAGPVTSHIPVPTLYSVSPRATDTNMDTENHKTNGFSAMAKLQMQVTPFLLLFQSVLSNESHDGHVTTSLE